MNKRLEKPKDCEAGMFNDCINVELMQYAEAGMFNDCINVVDVIKKRRIYKNEGIT